MARRLCWILGSVLILALAAGVAFWFSPVGVFHAWGEARFTLAGAHSRTVSVRGLRIHYYVLGPQDGPPVVLVHGLGGRADDWQNLAPYLTRAGYRVYLPDLPGYGRSEQPPTFSYSVPDEASFVVDFLDTLQLRQIDLGGWSMGGWIVQRVASAHPERVRHLMLFDSAGLGARPAWDTSLFTPSNTRELDDLDALLMPHPPQVPDFVARDILRRSKKNAWVVRRALASMLTGQDVTDTLLPRLRMPVLLVWGEEDRITPLAQGQAMHKLIPQSELEVIAGCGHLAPNQCAAEAAPGVVSFLEQPPVDRASAP